MLESAILQLEASVSAGATAEVGSTDWWRSQANAIGLSMLRSVRDRKLDPVQADQFRKQVRQALMLREED